MSKKAFGWIIAILVIALILVIANKKTDDGVVTKVDTVKKSPVKIGFIGPLSGEAASLGTPAQAAVELAIEEVNAAGGLNGSPVEVIYEDGKCGSAAAAAAQKLMNIDKVSFIIGGMCSGETSTFVKTAMDQKVPVISYCSSAAALTGSGKYFFRNYISDASSDVFASQYLYNKLSAKKVAVIYSISDWGSGHETNFKKEFLKLGGEVVASEGVQISSKDFRTQLAKIKSTNPDYIYMIMYPDSAIAAVNQMKEMKLTQKVLLPETGDDPNFIKTATNKVDLQYFITRNPSNEDFAAKLIAKTKGTAAPACSPQAYDAAKIVTQVIGKVGIDPDAIAAEMHNVVYDGVSGKTSFDENGDLTSAEFMVKRIVDGKATEIK